MFPRLNTERHGKNTTLQKQHTLLEQKHSPKTLPLGRFEDTKEGLYCSVPRQVLQSASPAENHLKW